MTPTEISNKALSQLPAGRIASLDEDSVQARYCKEWYQQTLESLLEMGPWRFARKTAALALQETNDREARWVYRYAAPNDLAFVLKVWDENVALCADYEFIGSYLYTNTLTAKVEYITTADNSAHYTALFRSALIAALAAAICMPITKSRQRLKDLTDSAEMMLQRAQAANHNGNVVTYGNFVPESLRARAGLTGLENIAFDGPEAAYPDFDPLGVYNEALDD